MEWGITVCLTLAYKGHHCSYIFISGSYISSDYTKKSSASNQRLCRLKELGIGKFAMGYGLLQIPSIPEIKLERNKDRKCYRRRKKSRRILSQRKKSHRLYFYCHKEANWKTSQCGSDKRGRRGVGTGLVPQETKTATDDENGMKNLWV